MSEKTIVITVLSIMALIILIIPLKEALTNWNAEDTKCYITIKESTVLARTHNAEIKGCPTKRINPTTKEEVEDATVKEIMHCWKTWGSGNENLFKEEGVYCHICTLINTSKTKEINLPKAIKKEKEKVKESLGLNDNDINKIKTIKITKNNLTSIIFIDAKGEEKVTIATTKLKNLQGNTILKNIETSETYINERKTKKGIKEIQGIIITEYTPNNIQNTGCEMIISE